jgi:phosphatidylglycerophosphate synthase
MQTTNAARSLASFRDAERKQESFLAPAERVCLNWLARRTPAAIHPDHLTALGLLAMMLAGGSYALARGWPPALLLVNFWIAVNWLGDSLDGTLARVRNRQRPRYGFYVDHMIDSLGACFLIGGLGVSGYMSGPVAVALLLLFLLLSINSYLATYTIGTFQLSFCKFSPTEIRLLLAVGNTWICFHPRVLGGRYLLFDIGGVVACAMMAVLLAVSVANNTRFLYRLESGR